MAQQHEACGFIYIDVHRDGKTEMPVVYRAPKAAEHFLRTLQEEQRKIKVVLANTQSHTYVPRGLAGLQHSHYLLYVSISIKLRLFATITEQYRGPAHDACNPKLRLKSETTTIPVVFCNLRGYDFHFLL